MENRVLLSYDGSIDDQPCLVVAIPNTDNNVEIKKTIVGGAAQLIYQVLTDPEIDPEAFSKIVDLGMVAFEEIRKGIAGVTDEIKEGNE